MTDLLSSLRPDEQSGLTGTSRASGTGDHRPDWSWLPDAADAPTVADLARHRTETARLLSDHGVTTGLGEGDGGERAWQLDPVPVIVDEQEWSRLDAGLVQRAELLDAVLQDLYGQRRLLSDTLLPAEVMLAHPGFLRAVDGLRLPGARELMLTATDLSRDASGGWVVLADRTEAPAGAGYAMEDRRVVARVLAGVYRQAPIQRIGPFFHALRLALQEVAPAGASSPRVVLLTSGPHSRTAFDQAYLSTMLGFPMVEGSDLLVREGRVWMQGLDDVEPVDVVLRRVDADLCDPLELRADSRRGVPGLVRALRAGTVSVVNPLGSSVLESPAVLAHLPRLARAVLGTDLALPSPPGYWCGDPSSRAYVLAHLDRLVLLPTSGRLPARGGAGARAVRGWTLSRAERDELAARVTAEPNLWVGQETVGEPGDRTAALRTFAVAREGTYRVMTGGLARLSPDAEHPVPEDARATMAKDVWVLSSDTALLPDPWLEESGTPRPDRVMTGISPRTAESLFAMGRHAERAEDTVRLLRALVDRWNDYHHSPRSVGGKALAALLAAADAAPPRSWGGLVAADGTGRQGTHLRDQLLDRTRPDSVASCVHALEEAAAAVRDQLSADTWLPLASMDRALDRARTDTRQSGAAETAGMAPVLDRVLEALLAIAGISAESMVRDAGWRLLDAGRRLERAQHVVRSLAATLVPVQPPAVEELVVESVLIAHESVLTYRRRHQGRADVAGVLTLLLTDAANPRSLAYQLGRLREDLAAVPASLHSADPRDRLLQDVVDLVTELDAGALAGAVTDGGRRERLSEVLESMAWRLRSAADEIALVHFAQPAASRLLDDTWGVENRPDGDLADGDADQAGVSP